jgi:hypothetical protein
MISYDEPCKYSLRVDYDDNDEEVDNDINRQLDMLIKECGLTYTELSWLEEKLEFAFGTLRYMPKNAKNLAVVSHD